MTTSIHLACGIPVERIQSLNLKDVRIWSVSSQAQSDVVV